MDLRYVFNEQGVVVPEATSLRVLELVLDAAKVLGVKHVLINLMRRLPLREELPVVLI